MRLLTIIRHTPFASLPPLSSPVLPCLDAYSSTSTILMYGAALLFAASWNLLIGVKRRRPLKSAVEKITDLSRRAASYYGAEPAKQANRRPQDGTENREPRSDAACGTTSGTASQRRGCQAPRQHRPASLIRNSSNTPPCCRPRSVTPRDAVYQTPRLPYLFGMV
jgi:hypothetical protein